jgi:uncharacterized protein
MTATLRFGVHVHPGTRTTRVGGDYDGVLEVRVRSRAVDGRATEEVRRALAEAFGVRVSDVRCLRGARARRKLIEVEGDDRQLAQRLAELLRR